MDGRMENKPPKARAYIVITGLNYPPEKRAEPGDVVSDLDPHSIPELIALGAIKPKE